MRNLFQNTFKYDGRAIDPQNLDNIYWNILI